MRPSSKYIEYYLNLYPEVGWDQFREQDDDFTIYGWIDREDGRSDFMLWVARDVPGKEQWEGWRFTTSSSKWSREFSRCLIPDKKDFEHIDCMRVEDLGLKVNAIRLVADV